MSSPLTTDLVHIVPAEVEVVKFGALKGWPLSEFIVRNIEPLKELEGIFHGEYSGILDPVARQIQPHQSCQVVFHRGNIC